MKKLLKFIFIINIALFGINNVKANDNKDNAFVCDYNFSNKTYSLTVSFDAEYSVNGSFRVCNWSTSQCPLSFDQFDSFFAYSYIKDNKKCPDYLVIDEKGEVSYFADTKLLANKIVKKLGKGDIYNLGHHSYSDITITDDRLDQSRACYKYTTVEECRNSSNNCAWKNGVCTAGNTIGDNTKSETISYNTVSCGSAQGIPAALPVFIKNVVNIIKIIVPIILIIMGMLDFSKAVVSNDEKSMKEAQNKFIKRIIAAVTIFLVVAITQFVFRAIGTGDTNEMAACINCFINGSCK